jgi:uncharacterized membrane protein
MQSSISSWNRETDGFYGVQDNEQLTSRKGLQYYVSYLHSHRGAVSFVINVVLLLIFYAWLVYGLVVELAGLEEFVAPLMLMQSLALVVFCVLHSMAVLGWKCALVFLVVTLLTTSLMEIIGVQTGVVFGDYHYNSALTGPQLLGMPLEIPLSWYMMLYPSFCVSDLIIEGRAHSRRPKNRWLNLATLSICTGLVMTGWDTAADPLGSTDSSVWVWTHGM